MSVHHWGESPIGRWILRMETRQPQNIESQISISDFVETGELNYFGLRIYGTNNHDDKNYVDELTKREKRFAFIPTPDEIESIYKRELAARESPNVIQKRNYQHLMKQRQLRKQNEKLNKRNQSYFELFRRQFSF